MAATKLKSVLLKSIVGGALLIGAWLAVPVVYDLDDAYIALYNAQAYATGLSFAYESPALSGSTSVPHVVAMSGLIRVGLSSLNASHLLTSLGFALFVWSIWLTTRALTSKHRLVVTVTAIAPFWLHASNGLETGLAFALTLLALTVREPWAIAALCGLLPATRPDLTLVAAAIWLVSAAAVPWPVRARMLAIALVCYVPWVVVLFQNTGALLPSTLAAKRYFLADACGHPLTYRLNEVWNGALLFAVIVGPLSLGLVGLLSTAQGVAGLLAIGLTLAAFAVELPQAVFTNEGRYLVPIIGPWLVFGAVAILRERSSTTWTVALISLASVTLAHAPWRTGAGGAELLAMTTWVNEHTDPSDVLMVQDAGAISVFSTRHLVDFVGIKSPHLIEMHKSLTWATCGARRAEAIALAARSHEALYLLVTEEWDRKLQISGGFPPGQLTRVRSHEVGRGGYDIYRIERLNKK